MSKVMMKVLIILCTTVGLTLANGVYHQESSYRASSAHYRNNELQRSNDDQGYYSKDGDLAGRTRPKINAHDEHQEYVNPKLREGQQNANYNMGDSYGQLSTQPGYRHGEFAGGAGHNMFNTGEGYASSGYQQGGSNSFQSYGIQSNLRQVSQSVQDDLARELQRAISEQHRRTAQYSSQITQAQMEADMRALEEEMRRNVTMRMQEAVRSRYGNQAMNGGYSYSIQNGRLQPNANFNNQELLDLTNQMQGDLRRQLEEGMRSYYRTEVRQTTTTTHHNNNGGYQPVIIQPRPYHPTPLRPEMHVVRPELRPFPEPFTQNVRYPPVVENPDSITTIATRVQHDLDEHLNKILDDTQRRYFSANAMHMNMNNFNYDTVLNQLENDLRRNITFQFEKHLGRNYAQYGNYNSRYSIEDVENLKRQMEQNLISKLNRDFNNQRQRYFQTQSGGFTHMTSGGRHQVTTGGSHMTTGGGYNQIYRPNGFYPSSDNYVASNIDTAEIQRRLQADLSRQLQDALMRHQYRQTHQYNAAYGNPQANYQVSLQQLSAELNRNLTRQLEHSMSGYSQSGNYNAQYANLRNQLQDELQRQLQQGLQQSYSSHSSWSSSSSSSSSNANNNFRPVRAFDQGLYHTYGGSSDLHAMGDDCMLGDDPSVYQTQDTQQLEDLNQKLTHQEMQQQGEDDQDLTQQVEDLTQQIEDQNEDLTQQIEDQNEDLTQQVEDLNQKQIASQDLTQKVEKQQDLTQQLEDQSDLTQQVEDLTQQVQKINDDLSSLPEKPTQQVVRPQKPLNMDYKPVYPRPYGYSSNSYTQQHSTHQGTYGQNIRNVYEDQQHPYDQTTGHYTPTTSSSDGTRYNMPVSYRPYSGREVRPLDTPTPASAYIDRASYNIPVSYTPYSGREMRPLDTPTPANTYIDRTSYNIPVSYTPYSGRQIRPLDTSTPASTYIDQASYNMPVSYTPYRPVDTPTPTSTYTDRTRYNMPVSYTPYSGREIRPVDIPTPISSYGRTSTYQRKPQTERQTFGQPLVSNDHNLQSKPLVGQQTLGQRLVDQDFALLQQQVGQQTLGQQPTDDNFGNPNKLGQQTEDIEFGHLGSGNVGQQTINLEKVGQQEQLAQQTEDNDFGPLEIGSQHVGQQNQDITQLGQQTQDFQQLGQQTEDTGLGKYSGLGQQIEDIGQFEIGSEQLGRRTPNEQVGQQTERVGKLEIGGYPEMPPQESLGQQVELEPFEIGNKPSKSQPISGNYLGQNDQDELDLNNHQITQQISDDDLTQQTEDIDFGKPESESPRAQIVQTQPLRIPQTGTFNSQKPIEFGQQTVDEDLTQQTVDDDLTQQIVDDDLTQQITDDDVTMPQIGDLTQQSQIGQHIEKLNQKLEDLTRDDAQRVEDAQIAQQSRYVPIRRPKLDGYGYQHQDHEIVQPVEPQISNNKIFKTSDEENPDSQISLNQEQLGKYQPESVHVPVQIADQNQIGTTRNRPNQLDNGYKPAYQSKPTYSQVLTDDGATRQTGQYRPYQFHYGSPRQTPTADSSQYQIHPVSATIPPKTIAQKNEDETSVPNSSSPYVPQKPYQFHYGSPRQVSVEDSSQHQIHPVRATIPPKIVPQKIEEAEHVEPNESSTQEQETEDSREEIAVKKPHNTYSITKAVTDSDEVEAIKLNENAAIESEEQTTTEEPTRWQKFKNAVKEKAGNIRDKLG